MGGKNNEEDKNNNENNKKEKKLSIQEKIIKIKWLKIIPFLAGIILLFIFIINACIYSNEIKLTSERIYLILGLFIIAIFPELIKEYFFEKMDNILKENPRLEKMLERKMIETVEKSKKINGLVSKVDGIFTIEEELNDEKSINKLEDDLEGDEKRKKIFLILKKFKNEKNIVKLFRRGNTKLFGLKNSSQIVVIGDNFNIKIKKDDITVGNTERENGKVIKMSNEKFEEYLENEGLKYFIGKLKINPYGKSLDTVDNYRWVKLDFKYVEDEKFSENFEKLLEVVLENNK